MGRNGYFDSAQTGVLWPNVSTLLVGGSGTGKNTIIEPAEIVLDTVLEETGCGVRCVQGRTMEAILHSLWMINQKGPAEGYIAAKELKDFFGGKDYQKGMIECLTELLSTGRRVDISNKTDMVEGRGAKFLREPTITMFGGSTPEWLQNIEGIMQGGFLPRFIVVTETDEKKYFVADPGRYVTMDQKQMVDEAELIWQSAMKGIAEYYRRSEKPIIFRDANGEDDAGAWFMNWYANRYKMFSPNLASYAERSSGLCRRIAMLMAASRHSRVLTIEDYEFAAGLVIHAAERLERSVMTTAKEIQVAYQILRKLPLSMAEVLRTYSPASSPRIVHLAMVWLIETAHAVERKGRFYRVEEPATPAVITPDVVNPEDYEVIG